MNARKQMEKDQERYMNNLFVKDAKKLSKTVRKKVKRSTSFTRKSA